MERCEMEITRQRLINGYLSAIHDGAAAFFIGAGISRESGFVDWKGFLKECADEIGLDLTIERDLVAVAQYYLNSLSGERWRLNQLLRDEFDKSHSFNRNHKLIAQLPVSTIWTTNFDSLIERSLVAAGRTVDVKTRDNDI